MLNRPPALRRVMWGLSALLIVACQGPETDPWSGPGQLDGGSPGNASATGATPSPAAAVRQPDTTPAADLLSAEVEHLLPTDRSDAYAVTLRAGEALHVVVEQDGIDLALDLWDAEGHTLYRVDGPGGPFGPELLAHIAERPETLRLEVRPLKGHDFDPRYRLQRRTVQPAGEEDRARAAAFQAHLLADRQLAADDAPAATVSYRRAAELWQQAAEPRLAARALRRLGQLQTSRDFAAALELFRRSRDLLQPLDKDWEWVGLHNDLGGAQRGVGDIAGAEASYREAEAVARQRGDTVGGATAISNLGLVAQAAGREEDALRRYRRAADLFAEADVPDRAAIAKVNRSMALASLGRYDDAEAILRQCLSYWRQRQEQEQEPDRQWTLERQASVLSSLGWLDGLRGRHDSAIELYDASLGLRRPSSSPPREAVTHMLRGQSHARLGNLKQAQEDMEQALDLQQSIGDRLGEAYGRAFLGDLLLREDNAPEAAEEHLGRASRLFEAMGDDRGLAGLDFSRARWHRRLGRLETARRHLEEGIGRLEDRQSRLLSPAFRRSVNAAEYLDLSSHVDLLLDLHRAQPAAGHDREAFEAAERYRSRGLSEELSLGAGWRLRADAELLQQQAASIEELQAAEMMRIDMARLRPDDPRLAQLEANIEAKLLEQARLDGEIRRSAGLPAQPAPEGLQLDALQQGLLDPQTTLLTFHIAPPREQSVAWVVRRDHFAVHALELDDEALATLTHGAVDAFEQGDHLLFSQRARRDIAELSHRLLPPPLVADLRGDRLLVVPDGLLALLPLALLDLPDGGKLGERFDVAHVPSTSVWAALRQRRAEGTPAKTAQAAVPQQDLAMIGASLYAPHPAISADGPARRDAARQHFGPLPGSQREAEAVLSLFRSPTLSLLGSRANRRTVLETRLDRFRIIHFATHGLLEVGRPELSAIVLSLVDEKGRPIDGYLRVTDLERLRLEADLVVVSACRTGRGEWVQGEGIFGIAHALFKAGAQALVVSHWAVDDAATAELMPRFYEELLEGHSPAAALRRAQRYLRQATPWHDPVHWAAFSVQGDGLEPLF